MPKSAPSGSGSGNKPATGGGGLAPAHGKEEKIHHGGMASQLPKNGTSGGSMRD